MSASGPEKMIGLFAQHVMDGNLEAALDLYESDALYLQRSGAIRGKAAIREVLRGLIASHPRMTGEPKRIHHAGDVALIFNRWSVEFARPDGTGQRSQGVSAVVGRLQADGTWRVAIDDPWGGPGD